MGFDKRIRKDQVSSTKSFSRLLILVKVFPFYFELNALIVFRMSHLTQAGRDHLKKVAESIVAPGKGILAADESTGTIGKRFADISVENIEENRRLYRQLLFTSNKEIAH